MTEIVVHQSKFQLLTRLGFVARALLYTTIAVLLLGAGRSEDPEGALHYLGTGLGRWLLLFLTAGFGGYGLWRLADAIFGMESGRGTGEAAARRLAAGASGAVHLFLAYQAFHLWQGAGPASAHEPQEQARTVLELPGGVAVMGILGVALLVAGGYQLMLAAKCTFLANLDPEAGRKRWVKWLGRFGYAARGVIFL